MDLLNDLSDDELQTVITRSNEILAERDRKRKDKALEDARAILAGAGLSLKDVAAGKTHKNGSKATVYHGGRMYQHPTNKVLVWNARGQKPHWLRDLESEGRKAIELPPGPANDNIPPSIKKTG
jgi:hypothetical protein